MKFNSIVSYGLILASIITILKLLDYGYLIRAMRWEIYAGAIATIFMGLGIWVGQIIIKTKNETDETTKKEVIPKPTIDLGISKREFEVLQLIAKGYSNQEIADQLFISLPTVKTHVSNLFSKLDVKRRTQAVKKATELKLITTHPEV